MVKKKKILKNMEKIFHQHVHNIIKSKENRKKIFNYIKKNYIDDILSEKEKENLLYYYIYEIQVEWNMLPKLDELYEWIKSKKIGYFHDVFNEHRICIEEEDNFIENPPKVEEGVIECKRCKSLRTISFNKQTRSGDEATTVFVRCSECNFQFKM